MFGNPIEIIKWHSLLINDQVIVIDLDIDDCKDNPCNNGGKCKDGIASYTCACPKGFTGTDCEISMKCSSNHSKINQTIVLSNKKNK